MLHDSTVSRQLQYEDQQSPASSIHVTHSTACADPALTFAKLLAPSLHSHASGAQGPPQQYSWGHVQVRSARWQLKQPALSGI